MAEFRGKQGHWVTTESGSHIFIESDGSFDEAVEKAFGKENKGKYKADKEGQNSYGGDFTNKGSYNVGDNTLFDDEDDWGKWATNLDKQVPKNWKSDGFDGDTRFYSVNGQKGVESVSVRPDGLTKIYTKNGMLEFNSLKEAQDFMNIKDKKTAIDKAWKKGWLSTNDETAIDDIFGNNAFDDDNDFENWDDEDSEYYYDPYEDEKYKTGLGEMQSTFDKPFWNDDDAKKIKKYLKTNPDVRDAVEKDLTKKANYLGNSLAKQDLNDQLSLLNDFDTFTTTEMDSAPRDDLINALQKAIHNKVNKK